MTQYRIYYANLAKATGIIEKKTRPIVVIGDDNAPNKVKALQVTSRMKEGKFYAHLNNFLVHGFVECKHIMSIDSRYLLNFVRETTISEKEAIDKIMKNLKTK